MTTPWSQALDDPDPAVRLLRTRIALETVVTRIRPGTLYYPLLTAGYLPLVLDRPADVTATVVALCVQVVFAVVRFTLYRRSASTRAGDPDRWRRIFATLSSLVILVWDAFAGFEVWSRGLDTTAMLLVTASIALRASGTYAASPDLAFHRMWSRWTRVPIIVAPLFLGNVAGVVTALVFVAHAVYGEHQAAQLNKEFWRRIVATDSLATAHVELQREVAMRQRAEVELRLAQKLESVGRLAGGIAHEINTPLQAMRSSLEFIEHSIGELMAIFRVYRNALPEATVASLDPELVADADYLATHLPASIELAKQCLDRTATIVRSIKTFAYPEIAGITSFDVNEALATTLTIARHEYAGIADVVTELGELPMIEAYAGELNHAFLNIIVNAAQAMAPHHAATGERGTLAISTRRDGDHVVVSIADTGVGIPEAIKDRVFDLFFTTKDVGQGPGQGLTIAHAVITKRHRGELTFAPRPGRGTTFTIRLPIGNALAAAA